MLRLIAILCLGTLLALPNLVAAQPNAGSVDPSRWGVAVSFVPSFEISGGSSATGKLAEVMFDRGDEGLDVKGSDFRVGIVRGRRLGGEWGVSYVRRSFDEDSTQGGTEESCFTNDFNNVTFCHTGGTEYLYTNGVTLDGIEVNKLIVFGTIKNRVQIGLDIAGGVGWMKGTVIERNTQSENANFNNIPPGTTIHVPFIEVDTEVPASTLVAVDPVPIGRVELAVGVILGRNLKLRASGGMNVPGTHLFSVTASYFFP